MYAELIGGSFLPALQERLFSLPSLPPPSGRRLFAQLLQIVAANCRFPKPMLG